VRVDLHARRGTTNVYDFDVTRNEAALDLSAPGAAFSFVVVRTVGGTEPPLIEKSLGAGISQRVDGGPGPDGAAAGRFQLILEPADTADLEPATEAYPYALVLTEVGGRVSELAYGDLKLRIVAAI